MFVALGLLGCGPVASTSTSEASSTGAGSTTHASGASASTTGATPTSGVGSSSTGNGGDTVSTSTGGSTSSGVTTGGVTGSTDTGVGESTVAGTSSGEMSSSSGDVVEPGCEELMQGFTDPPVPSGWQKCGDQLPHRVSVRACVVPTTPAKCDLGGSCKTNADCTDQPFGSCQQKYPGDSPPYCDCIYGCETDADCGAGHVCLCGGENLALSTRCVPSECTADGDCGAERCQFSESEGQGCGMFQALWEGACTTANDQCDSDVPCMSYACTPEWEIWQCNGAQCGRPFIVDEQVVTAPVLARGDWSALIAALHAPVGLRAPLARYWTQIACCEHASIASFARFILQLLAVGAPPGLVLAAAQALADEVEHARLCFAIASQHAGHDVGPGPLPQAGAPGAEGLAEIVEAVIREACVGETLSALEVREAAARAEDPGLRRILGKIAEDEQRHAELGWRFVQWALVDAETAVQARALRAFDAAIAGAHADAERMSRERAASELRGHGVLDGPLRAAVWQEGLRSMVAPAAAGVTGAAASTCPRGHVMGTRTA